MCGKNRQKLKEQLKLYLILETSFIKIPLEDFVNQVVDGGVTTIQLRNKYLSAKTNTRKDYDTGITIKKLIEKKNTLFIVNDRADLANILKADGVHVGTDDIPAHIIKKAYPNMIIGYSCHSINNIEYANSFDADYIGIGSIFSTDTKNDIKGILGPAELHTLAHKTDIPSVAIGGINQHNLEKNFKKLAKAGISGICISSAICKSETPYETTKKIRKLVDNICT